MSTSTTPERRIAAEIRRIDSLAIQYDQSLEAFRSLEAWRLQNVVNRSYSLRVDAGEVEPQVIATVRDRDTDLVAEGRNKDLDWAVSEAFRRMDALVPPAQMEKLGGCDFSALAENIIDVIGHELPGECHDLIHDAIRAGSQRGVLEFFADHDAWMREREVG